EIPWDEIIKKEARGIDDADLGEVQHVNSDYVVTQKGILDKEWFHIPRNLVTSYDGNKLIFRVTKEEAENSYLRNERPVEDAEKDEFETHIPMVEERLEPTTKVVVEQATIVKEPIKETKTIQVPLTHEELVIERKTVEDYRLTDEKPVESRTEIKIPLKREEVEATKQSYVKEEIILTKKQVTETRTITEELASEKLTEEG
ncbi:MAG: YsnF/AvaK domain-containing protein, partial [Nitrososphaeraceae archaeon]